MVSDRQLTRLGLTMEQYVVLMRQQALLEQAEACMHQFDNREDEDDDC